LSDALAAKGIHVTPNQLENIADGRTPLSEGQLAAVAALADMRLVLYRNSDGAMQVRLRRRRLNVTIHVVVSASPAVPTIARMVFASLPYPDTVHVRVAEHAPLQWQHLAYFSDSGVTAVRVDVPFELVAARRGPVLSAVGNERGCPLKVDVGGIEGTHWLAAPSSTPEAEDIASSWIHEMAAAGAASERTLNRLHQQAGTTPVPPRDGWVTMAAMASLVTETRKRRRPVEDTGDDDDDDDSEFSRPPPALRGAACQSH
jgi:hypothetical protein